MMAPTLSIDQLAHELGRSTDWVYRNWQDLCAGGMPPPIATTDRRTQLVWSRAQIYAWLDRRLDDKTRRIATAIRLAEHAMQDTANDARHFDPVLEQARRDLDKRYGTAP